MLCLFMNFLSEPDGYIVIAPHSTWVDSNWVGVIEEKKNFINYR